MRANPGVDTGLGVGFNDDNPGYTSGLSLDRLRAGKLAAPRWHPRGATLSRY